jgi:hypothetical protein
MRCSGSGALAWTLEARGDPRVVARRVLRHYDDVPRRFRETTGNRLLDQSPARGLVGGACARVQTMLLESGDSASAILHPAERLGAGTIILGSCVMTR